MRLRFLLPLLVLLPASFLAQAAPPEVPPTLAVDVGEIAEITLKVPAGKDVGYRVVGGKAAFREVKGDNPDERVYWLNGKQGKYSIVWWTVGEKGSSVTDVTIGKPTPDVIPTPKPKPDDPTPSPDAAPIPVDGFRVFVLYDEMKQAKLTAAQTAPIYSADVRLYLRDKCVKGPDGTTPEWRMWSNDTDASEESKLWQDAYARAKTKAASYRDAKGNAAPQDFWLMISTGKTGYEGPLPQTKDEMLAKLKQFGG